MDSEMPPAGARPSRMESSDPAAARSSAELGILTEVGRIASPCFDESSSESEERPPKSDRMPHVRFMTANRPRTCVEIKFQASARWPGGSQDSLIHRLSSTRPRTGTATQAASSRMNTMAAASELPLPP